MLRFVLAVGSLCPVFAAVLGLGFYAVPCVAAVGLSNECLN